VAAVRHIRDLDGSWEFSFDVSDEMARFVVPKGSIALDGVSLTVAEITENGERVTESEKTRAQSTIHDPRSTTIQVAIIPHTYYHTTFQFLKIGDTVNVELDIIAKMVERLVKPYLP
jgi:riboflavin synthase